MNQHADTAVGVFLSAYRRQSARARRGPQHGWTTPIPGGALVDHAEDDGYDMQAVQRVYEGMADDYAVPFGAHLREHDSDTKFLDAALADLPDGPVLDVGCGPAQVSGFLIRRGRTAIGIDLAPGMLA